MTASTISYTLLILLHPHLVWWYTTVSLTVYWSPLLCSRPKLWWRFKTSLNVSESYIFCTTDLLWMHTGRIYSECMRGMLTLNARICFLRRHSWHVYSERKQDMFRRHVYYEHSLEMFTPNTHKTPKKPDPDAVGLYARNLYRTVWLRGTDPWW